MSIAYTIHGNHGSSRVANKRNFARRTSRMVVVDIFDEGCDATRDGLWVLPNVDFVVWDGNIGRAGDPSYNTLSSGRETSEVVRVSVICSTNSNDMNPSRAATAGCLSGIEAVESWRSGGCAHKSNSCTKGLILHVWNDRKYNECG